MQKKSYKITFALQSGYAGTGENHPEQEVSDIIETWMLDRINNDLPTVSGILQFGKLIFPAKGRREDRKIVTATQSGIYSGELSSESDNKRTVEEVIQTLESLAKALKEKLKQEKVYIIYQDKNWFI